MKLIVDNTVKQKPNKRLDAVCSFCNLIQKDHPDVIFVETSAKPGATLYSICAPCVKHARAMTK